MTIFNIKFSLTIEQNEERLRLQIMPSNYESFDIHKNCFLIRMVIQKHFNIEEKDLHYSKPIEEKVAKLRNKHSDFNLGWHSSL